MNLQDWEKERQKIIGSKDKEECLTYFKCEEEYLEQNLEADYNKVREERETKFKELFTLKQKIVSVYEEIYAPIKKEIIKLLGDLEETIEFEAEMQLAHDNFAEKILSFISQKYAGVFKGKLKLIIEWEN